MPSLDHITKYLHLSSGQAYMRVLYGASPASLAFQTERYLAALDSFRQAFPDQVDMHIFSSPGRTEVGGNHTDHNAGRILAAAVDLDILAVVAPNDQEVVRVYSQGYPPSIVSLAQLQAVDSEKYTTTSLIRGIAARMQGLGFRTGGFDAVLSSRVPKGSGLSSSAAFEILIAVIFNDLFNQGRIDRVPIAQIGQYAESQYFGKPCGLMDQTTCMVGGFVTIDFKDFLDPLVKKVPFDFSSSGYTLVIVDTAWDHADLTDEYAAVEYEMKSVARALGGQVLRELSEDQVMDNIRSLRGQVSDRAILRAIHFFREDQRVVEQVNALEAGDFGRFLELVNESGRSSWMLNQNCYTAKAITRQGISIALTVSQALLSGRGAWRVHGGGFAGTIQAFVPDDLLSVYFDRVERIYGPGSCHAIRVRPEGALRMPV